jgi:hypothetical protein
VTITAVRAARWDTSIERGGAWKRVLRRRVQSGDPILIGNPCVLRLFAVDPVSGDAGAQALAVTGVVAVDNASVSFLISDSVSATLAAGRYQHKVTVTDPTLGVLVLLRGYFTVYDDVEG